MNTLPFPNAAELITRARTNVERRPHFRKQSPERKAALVQQEARRLAIAASPIGATAARIGHALTTLTREIEAFLRDWSDAAQARSAVRAAFAAAGLEWPEDDRNAEFDYGPEYLNSVPDELAIWAGVLSIAAGRLEECCALPDEPDAAERRAA